MKLRSIGISLLELLACLFSAGMLFLAFPYFNLDYLAWFALVPWFFAIQNKSRARALLLSYFTGVMFWGATVYWLIHVTLAGMIGMVLYLALYFAAFGFIVSTTRVQLSVSKVLFVPAVWVLLEFLRSHLITGFPWALAGYTQSYRLPVIQIADLTGVWGISFLVIMVNTAVKGIIGTVISRKRIAFMPVALTALLAGLSLGYGYLKLQEKTPGSEAYTIAIVQGNVAHELKWQPETRDQIMATHLKLSARARAIDLVVWSEAALPVILEDEPQYFEQTRGFVKENNIPLLMGTITHRGGEFFNSALLLLSSGEVTGSYDKIHLVPFGEYIPLRKVFTFLETLAPIGELTPGKDYNVFSLPCPRTASTMKFSTLICFEDLFPEMARKFVHEGAGFLVNITNDAWYRYSPATYQHCQSAVIRAVENRVPIVRCANTGISCFIDRTGAISGVVKDGEGRELFVDGYSESRVTVAGGGPTIYTRYGDYFIWFCWFFVFIGAVMYFADKL